MTVICEPLKDKVLLKDRLEQLNPKTVAVCFWHGVGDLIMFLEPYRVLQELYPAVSFKLALPLGLGYEDIVPDAVFVTGDQVNKDEETEKLGFDLFAKITFPMNEFQQEFTKGEFCCIHELGISPVWGHSYVGDAGSPLVAVHYQITCLPDSANPDEKVAEAIWKEILDTGLVPIECHFEHVFHNPVNKKFPFVTCSVRGARPKVSSLVGLIQRAKAFVGVVSGPFHVALSVLPSNRIMLLEKDFKAGSFTKKPIATANLKDYKGEVGAWLKNLIESGG